MIKRVKKILEYIKSLLNRNELLFAVVSAVVVIFMGTFLGWYNNKVVAVTSNPIARYLAEPHNPLSFMSNWDGPDYISIATHGYTNVSQASFFPLYPMLIHALNHVIGSPLYSALVISWLCLIGAIYYYTRITKQLFKIKGNITTLRALVFFVIFPTAIFLAATYTESLFAFLALAAIYYALNGKYLKTAVFSLLCCATHLDGVFVLALVCMILIEQKVNLARVLTTLIIGLLGLVDYSIYLSSKFHNTLAFISSQKSHGWLNHQYSEITSTIDLLNLVFIVLIIITAVYWWKRRRSFSIYSLFFLLIPLIGNQFGGFNRYVLMVFPIQFMAYDYFKKRPFAYSILLCLLGILWAYSTLQYTGGYTGS